MPGAGGHDAIFVITFGGDKVHEAIEEHWQQFAADASAPLSVYPMPTRPGQNTVPGVMLSANGDHCATQVTMSGLQLHLLPK